MQLWPIKGHYFLWSSGTSPVYPFMPIYAKQLGFPGFVIGLIYTVFPLSKILLLPIIGGVADKYKIQKKLFLIIQTLAALAFFSLIFLPRLPTENRINFICNDTGSSINIENTPACADRLISEISSDSVTCKVDCQLTSEEWWFDSEKGSFDAQVSVSMVHYKDGKVQLPVASITINDTRISPVCFSRADVDTECDVICDTLALNQMTSKPKILGKDIYSHYQFWLLFFVYFCCAVGYAFTFTFSDTICLQILGDQRYKFGYQRMFSSFGWGIFAFVAGYITDLYSAGEFQTNYLPAFGMSFGILLLCVFVSSKIQYTQQPHKAHIIRDVTQRLLTVRVTIFMLWCMLFGVCWGIHWGFIFWLLEDLAVTQGCDVVGKIKTIEGASLTIEGFLGEVPFYLFSSWIFKRLKYTNSMTLAMFLIGIRFTLHSCISNPWWNLPISALNGFVNSWSFAAMISYASVVAPSGAETTTQGMIIASFQAGNSLGSFLGGLLIGYVGPSKMFRIFGIVSLTGSVIHALAQYLVGETRSRREIECNQFTLVDAC